ncbi:hypothetical protein [Xanthomonas hortorum]
MFAKLRQAKLLQGQLQCQRC